MWHIPFIKNMNDLTVSESLFEQFCKDNSIQYTRISEKQYKTPDYDLHLGKHLIIVEIKQTDSNKTDKELLEKLRSRGTASGWEESGRRVRIKIDSAKNQLKSRSQGRYPAVLVLYDNVPAGSIDAADIKTAMYGHENAWLIASEINENTSVEIEKVGFGAGRKCTPDNNRTISAIALLYNFGGRLRLSLFHNIYAKHPIDPSWLRRDTVRHFTLTPQYKGKLQEWQEI